MFFGAPYKYNETSPNEGAVYVFTPQGETWMEHAKLTASDWFLLFPPSWKGLVWDKWG